MSWLPALRMTFLVVSFVALALPAFAERSAALDALVKALKFDETIEIMQQEGSTYGDALAEQMLPDTDRDRWSKTVARIYDREKMLDLILVHFKAELSETNLQPLLDYYQSEEGGSIVALEISARQMFLDPDIEDLASETFEQLENADAPIVSQIQKLIVDSDLVEMNVMGALNSELMFYRGLNDGGAIEMSEEEMLTEVGNIVLNSVIGAIGNAVTQELRFSVLTYVEDSIDNLLH